MKTVAFIALLCLLRVSCFAQMVADPKQDFLSRLEPIPGDTYEKLEADFNNDGQIDVAYTAASLKNDSEAGDAFAWDFYVRVEGGFNRLGMRRLDGSPDLNVTGFFRKDAYWIGIIPELGAYGLLSMSQAIKQKGDTKAELYAILFTSNTLQIVPVGGQTSDIEALKKRFPKILTPPVQPIAP